MADGNGCGDLQVRIVSRQLVKASDLSVPPHVLAFSNLDLLYRSFPVSLVCVYPRPTSGDFAAVVASFTAALPPFLNHFFPLAGRIATNPRSGLPELHCTNEGAELVVAYAGAPLSSLDFTTTATSLGKLQLPYDADSLALSVQIVSFACGGFSVAWRSSHVVMDGCAIHALVAAWSAFARRGTLDAVPNHDRASAFLRPRSPPSYAPSFGEAYTPHTGDRLVNVLTSSDSFVERLYYVDARDVDRLRAVSSGYHASRMEAVSAYLWKALAAVVGDGDASCRMGWWVDGRRHVTSTSPPERRAAYFGNVTSFAVKEARVDAVARAPLPDVAALVRQAVAAAANAEHFRELVDWLEEHKTERWLEAATVGLGSPAATVTWCASFRPDTDFGFGRAAVAMPASASGRLCSGYFIVAARPGGDGALFVSAFVWPKLVAVLESDTCRIFKPLTAEYLGFTASNTTSRRF